MSAWWDGVAPALATVDCSGAVHRLSWHAGRLTALDHADPEAERALAALGGERCTCVEMLDAWAAHASDPRVLTLGPRGRGDVIALAPEQSPRPVGRPPRRGTAFAATSGVTLRPAGTARPATAPLTEQTECEDRLPALLALGGGVPRRLVASVAAGLLAAEITPQLHAALYGRLLATLRTWLSSAECELALTVIDPTEQRSLTRAETGEIMARLPFSWLVEVWARELELTWGLFTLAAGSKDARTWELLGVAPDLAEPITLTIALPV